jgi:hypothetical protein
MTRGTQPLHSLCLFFYIPPLVRPRCELQLSGCPIGVSWDVPAAVVFPKTPLPDASLSLQANRDAYQQHLKNNGTARYLIGQGMEAVHVEENLAAL